jgi:hypothetical protein
VARAKDFGTEIYVVVKAEPGVMILEGSTTALTLG